MKGEIMCEFCSWIEYQGHVYFLTNDDLKTKEGEKRLLPEVIDDLHGHGAIRAYYPELQGKGTNKECTDFSSSKNFPDEIVSALKKGKLSKFGINLNLLNKLGREKYEAIEKQAREKYEAIEKQAWEKYEAIEKPAREKYEAIEKPAREKYEAIKKQAREKYEAIEKQAMEKYETIKKPALWEIFKIKKYRNTKWL